MGVYGLWDIVAPAGRRVSPEMLSGRKLAVDASIWLIQFLKALRHLDGHPIRNAHLVGFFWRLCRLLFYRITPIVVFDGPAPELKRHTILQRRARREQGQLNLRKAAQMLLVNAYKQRIVETAKNLSSRSDGSKVMESPLAVMNQTKKLGLPSSSNPVKSLSKKTHATVGLPGQWGGSIGGAQAGDTFDRSQSMAVDKEEDEFLSITEEHFEAEKPAVEQVVQNATVLQPDVSNDGEPPLFVETDEEEDLRDSHRRRRNYYENIPEEFRGFLSERRRLDDISIPESILRMPLANNSAKNLRNKSGEERASMRNMIPEHVFREAEEFKEYRLEGPQGMESVQLPLDAEIDPDVFKTLPSKVQYQILTQLRDAWFNDSRVKALQATQDLGVFSNVQIESYIRSIRTNQEIDKVKAFMASELLQQEKELLLQSNSDQNQVYITGSIDVDQYGPSTGPAFVKSLGQCSTSSSSFGEQGNGFSTASYATVGVAGHGASSLYRKHMTRKKGRKMKNKFEYEPYNRLVNGSLEPSELYDGVKAFSLGKWEDASTKVEEEVLCEWFSPKNDDDILRLKDEDIFGSGMLEPLSTTDIASPSPIKQNTSIEDRRSKEWLDVVPRHGSVGNVSPGEVYVKEAIPLSAETEEDKDDDDEFKDCQTLESGSFNAGEVLGTVISPQNPIKWKIALKPKLPDGKQLVGFATRASKGPQAVSLDDSFSDIEDTLMKPAFQKGTDMIGGVESLGSVSVKSDHPDAEASSGTKQPTAVLNQVEGKSYRNSWVERGKPFSKPDHKGMYMDDNKSLVDSEVELVFDDTGDYASPFSDLVEEDVDMKQMKPIGCSEDSQSALVPSYDAHLSQRIEREEEGPSSVFDRAASFLTEKEMAFSNTASSTSSPVRVGGTLKEPESENGSFDISTSVEPSSDIDLQHLKDIVQNFGFSEDWDDLQAQLEEERDTLRDELSKLQKDADYVTEEMQEEVKELLRAFGVPFVDAPAEAEAQCAMLNKLGLCDGVISDDSDALVFGSTQVYRNFFESRKTVELYELDAINRKLGLSNTDLTLLAQLLGCDYTVGVNGVGIVNALETIKAFPSFAALQTFKKWAQSPWMGTNEDSDTLIQKLYKDAHKNYRLYWEFPDDFPSAAVMTAFMNPVVDISKETFSWRKPNLADITKIITTKTSLTSDQVQQTIAPVMARLADPVAGKIQTRIDQIFSYLPVEKEDAVATIKSKRMLKALESFQKRVTDSEEREDVAVKPKTKSSDKRKSKRQTPKKRERFLDITDRLQKKLAVEHFPKSSTAVRPSIASPSMASPSLSSPSMASPSMSSPPMASPSMSSPPMASPSMSSPPMASPSPGSVDSSTKSTMSNLKIFPEKAMSSGRLSVEPVSPNPLVDQKALKDLEQLDLTKISRISPK